jgi:hypothetical protein
MFGICVTEDTFLNHASDGLCSTADGRNQILTSPAVCLIEEFSMEGSDGFKRNFWLPVVSQQAIRFLFDVCQLGIAEPGKKS